MKKLEKWPGNPDKIFLVPPVRSKREWKKQARATVLKDAGFKKTLIEYMLDPKVFVPTGVGVSLLPAAAAYDTIFWLVVEASFFSPVLFVCILSSFIFKINNRRFKDAEGFTSDFFNSNAAIGESSWDLLYKPFLSKVKDVIVAAPREVREALVYALQENIWQLALVLKDRKLALDSKAALEEAICEHATIASKDEYRELCFLYEATEKRLAELDSQRVKLENSLNSLFASVKAHTENTKKQLEALERDSSLKSAKSVAYSYSVLSSLDTKSSSDAFLLTSNMQSSVEAYLKALH